ncbi:glycosyltransferase [Enorma burkinafasonensis]|uniref:glycosyltransferase n=1 Tax=Enorma burkinafasonensis TaxID=2590867 RepID=UPI0026F2BBBE|nr:glycosyltransferase [Enorma burkinafasonensis]MCI7730302.1 glycosyltransferase [Enorma burkinafasonensis]
MEPVIVIPTYWVSARADARAFGSYDHATPLDSPAPELDRCLASLEQVHDVAPIVLLVVCPLSATGEVARRVAKIVDAHPSLAITTVTNDEAAFVMGEVERIAPRGAGECVSLRGYGAIRNMGLAVAAIQGRDTVVFLDDDEVAIDSAFMAEARYALGHETRQGLPILAKSGYYYNEAGSPFADEGKVGLGMRWWTRRAEFNEWMRRALGGTRISRSNYLCGGCCALSARAFTRVAFDPYITRGEDLDYLCNLRLHGLDVWFDNAWVVRHLPPRGEGGAQRFMADVYRWYYERAKLADASRRNDLTSVTAASLMPYPGPWFSDELDARVRKTALARALTTSEREAYWDIYRHGKDQAERYASERRGNYLRIQSFWPAIMDGLWNNTALASRLEDRR